MAQLLAVKTNYGKKLENIHSRLFNGNRFKMADLKDKKGIYGIHIIDNGHRIIVGNIGANSFGLEVYTDEYGWTALEQFTKHQQKRIISSIDWQTLC